MAFRVEGLRFGFGARTSTGMRTPNRSVVSTDSVETTDSEVSTDSIETVAFGLVKWKALRTCSVLEKPRSQ